MSETTKEMAERICCLHVDGYHLSTEEAELLCALALAACAWRVKTETQRIHGPWGPTEQAVADAVQALMLAGILKDKS